MAGALPSDGVGHLAAGAGLLGENDSAAVAAQPADGFFDYLGVGHGCSFQLLGSGSELFAGSKNICSLGRGIREVTGWLPPGTLAELRAADALQLAALAWRERAPFGDVFLTAHHKLREAAMLSGFDGEQLSQFVEPASLPTVEFQRLKPTLFLGHLRQR